MEACHQELISPALRQAECDAKRSTGTESLRKLAYHFCDLLWCCLVGCGSNAEHCHASIEHNFAASEPPSEQSTIPSIHSEPESSKAILKTPPFLTRAADKGVFFRLSFNEELAGNPSGGIRQGFSASQYMIFGSDLDLQKLVGLRGAAFYAIVIGENSDPLSKNYIGGGIEVQENAAPFNLGRFLNYLLTSHIWRQDHNGFRGHHEVWGVGA
jgi:hypothetical protein